ncbi:pyridoxal-phosphate dependent enzyme [Sphingosinicella sp. BN140058]|uniref:pyridoxal-phosphate dependent enzyme n=1 Tax=Sphingosinicella sp. BN140058 TaxID=1892855 RepID=UPI0010119BC7|nr:pyridoxal-phosphate dependent enzyme [Sphingosinicella sp. BN140058]QAY79216.1 pyridoxal-phosphate dependent enzyme [Sphingosinicella sp. BN140058]
MTSRAQIIEAFRTPIATPLIAAPAIAVRCGVGAVLIKDESRRSFGNFKMLGGLAAGLSALARFAGTPVESLFAMDGRHLPPLVCASDGNHGLAVAAAASAAATRAIVFLHDDVDHRRAARIRELGAEIVRVSGTYDDAVDRAATFAAGGGGLLIADTSERTDDPVVTDVIAGYRRIIDELEEAARRSMTHAFIQAGVGGLAAAVAEAFARRQGPPIRMIVVEPDQAACVGHALRHGVAEPIPGSLVTTAEMLSCGVASVPALAILQRHGAEAATVSETELGAAVPILAAEAGVEASPSGAAGLAGLLRAAADPCRRAHFRLDRSSTVFLVASEGAAPSA